ncbi:hypothetical protein Bbelb_300490 [Branchiostoma belcheri]|nr:hypothetical protein Bbelb_300490 [Branchiostoma belcheri]
MKMTDGHRNAGFYIQTSISGYRPQMNAFLFIRRSQPCLYLLSPRHPSPPLISVSFTISGHAMVQTRITEALIASRITMGTPWQRAEMKVPCGLHQIVPCGRSSHSRTVHLGKPNCMTGPPTAVRGGAAASRDLVHRSTSRAADALPAGCPRLKGNVLDTPSTGPPVRTSAETCS